MRWWITRPGRAMALLAALAMWPAWVGLAMFVEWSSARGGDALAIAVTCGALLAVAAWIATQPSELVAVTARRHRFGWTSQCVLVLVAMALGVRWEAWKPTVMIAGALAALGLGLWHLALARRARRWATGVLRIDERGPCIETRAMRFELHELPSGAHEGDDLTIPEVAMIEGERGPYRSGRPHGHAKEIWRARGDDIATRLRRSGAAIVAFAILTAVWAAL